MITEKRRRGPPKSDVPPLSGKERARRHREKIKNNGGAEVKVNLDADEIALLNEVRQRLNLPVNSTNADVIKAMAIVLAGKKLITAGSRLKADLITLDSTEDTMFSNRWPLCLPGTLCCVKVKTNCVITKSWK